MSAVEIEADRAEAASIVAKIEADAIQRLGRLPTPTERVRWSRVFALAAQGLLAAPAEVPAAAPTPANTGKPRGPSPILRRKHRAKEPSDRPAEARPGPPAASSSTPPSPEAVIAVRPTKPPQRRRPVVIEVGS